MKSLILPSPAKLNLFLHILGCRDDGYHEIQTLFQFVDWCDEIEFSYADNNQIQLTSNTNTILLSDNLVMKAALAFQKASQVSQGISIRLEKQLPIGSGLGGGSSNAATTLLALNYLWKVQWSLNDLMALGKRLGADVPIFLYGHSAWAEGIGDQLTRMLLPESWYVLLLPQISVNTASLFQNAPLPRNRVPLAMNHYKLGQGQNDFESILRPNEPEIMAALDWLGKYARSRLTGTGSVVFARFDSKEEAGRIAAHAPEQYQAKIIRGLNRSPLHGVLDNLPSHWGVAKR